MVLMKDTPFEKLCERSTMYAGQLSIQKFLLFVALICIPWMLLAKPIMIMRNRKNPHPSVSIIYMKTFMADEIVNILSRFYKE